MSVTFLNPKLITLFFIFLSFAPTGSYGFNNFFPLLDLMAIYYWTLYRPHLMQNWFVFLAGLLVDVLSGGPIGLNALLNLTFRCIVAYKGHYVKKSFTLSWQAFTLLAAVVISAKWIVFSLVTEEFFVINSALMQLIMSALLYPLFHSIFNIISVTLPRSRSNA